MLSQIIEFNPLMRKLYGTFYIAEIYCKQFKNRGMFDQNHRNVKQCVICTQAMLTGTVLSPAIADHLEEFS